MTTKGRNLQSFGELVKEFWAVATDCMSSPQTKAAESNEFLPCPLDHQATRPRPAQDARDWVQTVRAATINRE